MTTLSRRRLLSRSAVAGGALDGCGLVPWQRLFAAAETVDAKEWIDDATEAAIKKGLDHLAERQQEDGAFGGCGYSRNVAVCALTGMAFMASGSTPMRGPYGLHTRRCVDYI